MSSVLFQGTVSTTATSRLDSALSGETVPTLDMLVEAVNLFLALHLSVCFAHLVLLRNCELPQ